MCCRKCPSGNRLTLLLHSSSLPKDPEEMAATIKEWIFSGTSVGTAHPPAAASGPASSTRRQSASAVSEQSAAYAASIREASIRESARRESTIRESSKPGLKPSALNISFIHLAISRPIHCSRTSGTWSQVVDPTDRKVKHDHSQGAHTRYIDLVVVIDTLTHMPRQYD